MINAPALGGKVKALRRRESITQAKLASQLGISASYLNLIENNRRPLTAPLLIKLAQVFDVDLASFATDDESRVGSELLEAFGDPLFETHGLTNADVREVCTSSPNVARAILTLYRAYVSTREASRELAGKFDNADGMTGTNAPTLPSEDVSDLIQGAMNYFPELEEAAEALWREADLEADNVYARLVSYLDSQHGIDVRVVRVHDERIAMRRYDPQRRIISISEVLPPRSRRFQVAHQVGLLTQSARIDQILRGKKLSTPESFALGRVVLANYFAAAVLMPYAPFLEAARAERYDMELLAHRFRASFEQVCHRLTTLRRKGAEGLPFHLLRIDMAGNISKRFSGSGIQIARFSGACPRWNVHHSFLTPGMIRIQVSRMPDGKVYFCLARTIRSDRGGYNVPHTVQAIGMGCEIQHARGLVYADGMDLDNLENAVPVGVTCRLCEHTDCAQRAFPSLLHRPHIQENVRGVSFYSPVDEK